MKKLLLSILILAVQITWAEEAEENNLNKKLDDLLIPDDKVAPVISEDKLYIVNTRYSSLVNRHEFSFLGAHNFTADSHLDVNQTALAYRYHLNSKWSFGLRYTRYSNELTSAGQSLFDKERIVPDTDYALNSQEIFATYNTIYGKIRWSADTVVYFDQFIALGGGQTELASGKTNHGFLDLGVAFWVGNHMSLRVGVKNEFYNQQQKLEKRFMHNAMGYLEIGYLFGQGDRG